MTLHVFNPEHDIALASGLANFTAPHAGRQLRHDIGFLPAIWAQDGDVILVDDVEQAQRSWQRLRHRLQTVMNDNWQATETPQFLNRKHAVSAIDIKAIDPWGWNAALRAELLRRGTSEAILPTLTQLETIRQLSHRRTAAALLQKLRMEGTVGEAFECRTTEEVDKFVGQYRQLVLKAPWSSSGRGVRFLCEKRQVDTGWLHNVMTVQGSIMVEPYYNKVKDFGMEFYSDGKGRVEYLGLSVFHTENGAYTGNILATEDSKRKMIGRYIPLQLLDCIRDFICQLLGDVFEGTYSGPFGIDMMVVDGGLLHPCVEINLRRTMGHVALALSPADDELVRVMRINYSENNYRFIINRLLSHK